MVKKSYAIFVGGQPGSGKTYFVKNYLLNIYKEYKYFDLDNYRDKNFFTNDPIEFSLKTKKDAGNMLNKLSSEAIELHENFIIECSLGKYNKTLINVYNKKNRYNIYIYLAISTLENSLLNIFERYINELDNRMTEVFSCISKYNEFNENLYNIINYADKIYFFNNNEILEINEQDFPNIISLVEDYRRTIYKKEEKKYKDRLKYINKKLSNSNKKSIIHNLDLLNDFFD